MDLTRQNFGAALWLGLVACGGAVGGSNDARDCTLTVIGADEFDLHPAEQRTLQVLMARSEAGPVSGGRVHFEFQGDPAGAALDARDALTDPAGIATIRYTAGRTATGRGYNLIATAPACGPAAASFYLSVIPLRRGLRIVATETTDLLGGDGSSAATTIGAGNTVALRVREFDEDTSAPIAGDDLTFTLPPEAISSGDLSWASGGAVQVVKTGAGGEAVAFLSARGGSGSTFSVEAQSSDGASVSFGVTVQLASSGSPCTLNAQCPPGLVCAGNPSTCRTPPGNPPPGDGCGAAGCAGGSTAPDVTGLWLTRHDFDIREALPAALQDVALSLRLVDQALHGKLAVTGTGWIDAAINGVLAAALQQYLPGWLREVISLGDTLFTLLSNLRSEGAMHLTRGADLRHLNGTEVWTNLVFYYLPLCNGNIGGDPAVPPECARIELATSDAETPGEVAQCKGQPLRSIAVQIAPFTALVSGSAAPFSLEVGPRQVRVEMGKVVRLLIDLIVSLTTPYHYLDEIADCRPGANSCPLLDCHRLGQEVGSTGWVAPGAVEAACVAAASATGTALTKALAAAWDPAADVLDFSGKASLSGSADLQACEGGTAACAARLGNDAWDRDLNSDSRRSQRDGSWSGDFFFKLVHKLPGAWQATRP